MEYCDKCKRKYDPDHGGCDCPDVSRFLAVNHKGMRIDHSGILGRIAEGCKVRQDQRWCLGEMSKHLQEMAKRFYTGDMKAVDEFLQLYCLDDERPKVKS